MGVASVLQSEIWRPKHAWCPRIDSLFYMHDGPGGDCARSKQYIATMGMKHYCALIDIAACCKFAS